MKVSSVSEIRELEQRAMEKFGITPEILMEDAGQAVFSIISREIGIPNRKFAVFCGIGNNGGDGFVVARRLHSNGAEVKVFLLGDKDRLEGAARKNFDIISKMGIEILGSETQDIVKKIIVHSDSVVDAILGTGLTKKVTGIYKDVINLINDYAENVFSVDIPSGVNSNNGEILNVAVNADHTITLGLPKIGNMLYPGYLLGGKLHVSHISLPPSLYNSDSMRVEIFHPTPLPERDEDTHKGDYGKTLFIAGSSNYLGAPYFCALSFLKAGGGLSYLATPKSISPFIAMKGSEVIFIPQPETSSGSIAEKSREHLLEFSRNVDIVVLGPGISLDEETQRLARELVVDLTKPLIIDGDGITAISEDAKTIREREAPTILTPHSGEMARIANTKISAIKKNRIDILQQTASELNAIIVLKGAHSLTGYPDKRVVMNTSGNPGMATAGSGDVLTGTIAAMYGLGLSIEEAVPLGVFLHGLSGDLAVWEKGEDGITAQDVLDYLPSALKLYREEFDEISQDFYGTLRVV